MTLSNEHIDISGWLTTRWGMNEQEMLTALRDVKVRKIDRDDYEGHYADHIVEDAKIGAYEYKVVLQMDKSNGGLGRVLMRHSLPSGAPQDHVVKAAFNALSQEFGSPQMLDRPGHFLWSLRSTKIQLYSVNLPHSLNLVSVIFSPANAKI